MMLGRRRVGVAVAAMLVLGACSQGATPQTATPAATFAAPPPTAEGTVNPRFDPTAGVGGGINSSNAISADDVVKALSAVPQVDKLKLSANSSPPGATGADVVSVSINAQDTGGLLKALDAAGKRALGEALLAAAGAAWPKATVSLLVSDTAGGGGQIIGSRPPTGQALVIAT
ncbi:MAG TPA: hypothetical protein VGQ62_09655 [Chloroflexota bacterium]|nr:hypothetical protein [Chloroflexota bacterium]